MSLTRDDSPQPVWIFCLAGIASVGFASYRLRNIHRPLLARPSRVQAELLRPLRGRRKPLLQQLRWQRPRGRLRRLLLLLARRPRLRRLLLELGLLQGRRGQRRQHQWRHRPKGRMRRLVLQRLARRLLLLLPLQVLAREVRARVGSRIDSGSLGSAAVPRSTRAHQLLPVTPSLVLYALLASIALLLQPLLDLLLSHLPNSRTTQAPLPATFLVGSGAGTHEGLYHFRNAPRQGRRTSTPGKGTGRGIRISFSSVSPEPLGAVLYRVVGYLGGHT